MEVDPSDQSAQNESESQQRVEGEEPHSFDWAGRWLKGHQYQHILNNVDAYCEKYGFQKYDYKCHPLQIYQSPVNGVIYFVKGKGVGSDFGFPRVEIKKRYRWKKMNFITNLPKRRPLVTYVVASAMRSRDIEEAEPRQYRMHAVIPFSEGNNFSENNTYILCHVRSVDHKKQTNKSLYASCFVQRQVDFYRLFAFLHNFNSPTK